MKDQDKNLAVAKFHGWEEIRHNPKTDLWYGKPPKYAAHPWDVVIPDYGKDLNAMHQVELKLTIHQQNIMNDTLWDMMSGSRYLWMASASEHREALLRTLSLWVEE